MLHTDNKRRFDIDNRIKCLLDGLSGFAWVDDHLIDELSIQRKPGASRGTAETVVEWGAIEKAPAEGESTRACEI